MVIEATAAKGHDGLVIFCTGGHPPQLRIFQNFAIHNGIYDSLDKSRLELAVNKGEQYEAYGYRMESVPNGY